MSTGTETTATVTGGAPGEADSGDGPEGVFAAAQQAACDELADLVGRVQACRATGLPRSTYYRHNRRSPAPERPAPTPHTERIQPRGLSTTERVRVRELLNSPEHVDEAPATVWAKLLDEGHYLCSVSTMYRILVRHDGAVVVGWR